MPKHNPTLEDKKDPKLKFKKSPPAKEPPHLAEFKPPIVETKTPQEQAARLDEGHLHQSQRHALAHQIGQVQGNHHLQRVVSHLREGGQSGVGNKVVQRDLLGNQRIDQGRIELRVSMPASFSTFLVDVTQGLGQYVSRARLATFMGSLNPALMDYYGSLEQSVPELTTLTLEIGLDTTAVHASLLRATNPGNPGEMVPLGAEPSPGATEEAQAEAPAPTTASAPSRPAGEEAQAETPAPTTASAPSRPAGEEAQAETPAPTTASAPARSAEEEAQAQTPAPASSGGRQQLPTIRTPLPALETILPPVPAGPVLIHPAYKLGGNFDIRPVGQTTGPEFRANVQANSPEIQQTFQDEFRQMGIEYTAGGPSLSIGDRRINMEMSVKPGYVLEFKTPVFPIRRRIGNCNIQANVDFTLTLRFAGNPAVLEAIMLAAGAAVSFALLIRTLSQIGAGLATAVESIFAGLASIGSRVVIPVILIPREAFDEILEAGPYGGRDGGIA